MSPLTWTKDVNLRLQFVAVDEIPLPFEFVPHAQIQSDIQRDDEEKYDVLWVMHFIFLS
jgi:hypothetical protein